MNSITFKEDNQRESANDHVYALDMNIEENMAQFKQKINEGLNIDISEASVWVLSQKQLSDFETLQELCGSFTGNVQIQFIVAYEEESGVHKVDILDVLKPDGDSVPDKSHIPKEDKPKKAYKTSEWVASSAFKEIQKKFNIPQNPALWSSYHVDKWLCWAKKEFSLHDLNPQRLRIDGKTLCSMNVHHYRQLVPKDPDDIFYMHFELLRKTQIVAVLHSPVISDGNVPSSSQTLKETFEEMTPSSENLKCDDDRMGEEEALLPSVQEVPIESSRNILIPIVSVVPVTSIADIPATSVESPTSPILGAISTVPVNTHPIQLWQFLLKLLTDPEATDIISWCGENGEFKFHQPDLVAKLWGEQKGKTNMNYDKLSRSLRYYYDSDKNMINKVNGKRYVYKFELDLRTILGYSSSDIQKHIKYVREERLNSS